MTQIDTSDVATAPVAAGIDGRRPRHGWSALRAVTLAAITFGAACVSAGASRRVVGAAPADLGAREVAIPSASGSTLRGWLAPGRRGRGAVLLLHGVSASRLQMLDRARFLHRRGHTVLLVDFQAHGESPGERVTYGALESDDAAAALAWLRRIAPGERVGAIGVSMGGAALLVGRTPPAVDALVLESVYPTIDLALHDRMRRWFTPLVAPLSPLVLKVLAPRLRVDPAQLRPIDRIHEVRAPLLVIAGTNDPYTPLPESRALYAHATAPKGLWEVRGAKHEDLHAYAPGEYEARVGAFLAMNLRGR